MMHSSTSGKELTNELKHDKQMDQVLLFYIIGWKHIHKSQQLQFFVTLQKAEKSANYINMNARKQKQTSAC